MLFRSLIDTFPVSCVINTGIAGGLFPDINIGDVVLATDAVEHDMEASVFGYPPGQIPSMDTFSFPADAYLRQVAKESCIKVNPEISVYEGRVVTGDQFISDKEKKEMAFGYLWGILYGDGRRSHRPWGISESSSLPYCPGHIRQSG